MSTQWHGGKGSARRPSSVSKDQYDSNWDSIFNSTPEQCPFCGEHLCGDGDTIPYHCINRSEEEWWYSEPDSGPWYCDYDDPSTDI